MAPVPITILTGFLGSGKTTLLLNLVPQLRATNPSYRLALLKNEFGDIAVDSQLASSSAVSGVREILNGCICCNLVGQLSQALVQLRDDVNADRIVIETSGSAFPATLAIEVNRLARETGNFTLDGVVAVIDVENWKGYDDTSFTARIQARYTDLIVFNKWEFCDERRFDECLDRVGDLEVDVAWVKSDRGRVSLDVIFGIDGGLARGMTTSTVGSDDHFHSHDHRTEVEVLSVTLSGKTGATVNAKKLLTLLSSAPKDEVYRIKSILAAHPSIMDSSEGVDTPSPSHQPQIYILNWAFGRWIFTPLRPEVIDHKSDHHVVLRMTVVLARYESGKWKRKLKTDQLLELDGEEKGDLAVVDIS
ncbi:CobW/HypB/UreG [Durotheca rogersii]|uniref:CobW/HypB/UreG n=1 Tax=Durotheca rogersii TaxID=419775 RepID=UPI00221EBBEB|nr:CobW/HypB/UreG [Durotheca rogersii]KAI5856219.1 CobW/HypB/UreG [Durotheca rogersii]